MIHAEKPIVIKNETLVLNSLRALYWPKEQVLITSDLHIGKSAHFRKHGIPMPTKIQHDDFERLSFLIRHYNAKRLIVVGDLFHAEINSDMTIFRNWQAQFNELSIELIKGNHDRFKTQIYTDFNIECCQKELVMEPFRFVHEPDADSQEFSISGHIHPGIIIKVKGSPRLRLPCFQISKNQLILPAFSEFTGLNTMRLSSDCISYAFTETSFFEF